MFTLYTAQKEESCNIYVHSVHSEETTRAFSYKQHEYNTYKLYGEFMDRMSMIERIESYRSNLRLSMIERIVRICEFTDRMSMIERIYRSVEYDRTDRMSMIKRIYGSYKTRNLFIFNLLIPQS